MDNSQSKLIVGLGNPGKKYDNTRHNIGFAVIDFLANKFGFNLNEESKFESMLAANSFEHEYSFTEKLRVSIIEALQDSELSSKAQELIDKQIARYKEELSDEEQNDELSLETLPEKFKPKTIKKEILKTNKISCKLFLAKPLTFMNDSGRAISKVMNFYKIPVENLLIIHDDVSLDFAKLKHTTNAGAGGQHGIEDTIRALGGTKKFHRLKFGVGPDPGGDRRASYVLSKFSKKEAQIIEEELYQKSLELIISDFLQH